MTAYDDGYTPARILAEQFGVTRSHLVRLATGRHVRSFRGGSDWYIDPNSLRVYQDTHGLY